ncbi:Riboflavin transporter [Wickerhamomyces ciferrii]|uniref:Riboflavin transporter n=1 Tax=Wickerhamomyces ciferrii (strain ATCC 14091 / BCRC 22168 / CBS 111 / JCM 3599 / NBRC 0793 / NRRL Y-1031 F-60-10) TaxID=1206466 RepID=K0KSK4_WICCF|nr:Riboflavin transporter [Wickerhamomyces ciferrii]CCH44298.1 Riboflavin transporter [Wickerhamomyces ciferrii]
MADLLPVPKAFKKDDDGQETTVELTNLTGSSQYNHPTSNVAKGSGFTLHTNDAEAQSNDRALSESHPAVHEINENEDENVLLLDQDLEFPEGGLKPNLVVFGSFMGLVPVFGMTNSSGAIEAYVSSHQLANVGTSAVSWIFSINIFIAFSSSIFSGSFFDRNGARAPMLIGAILFSAGLFATGNSTTVYQFVLSYGVVNGLGLGMMMSPLIGVVSHYFKRNRATALSCATTGGSIGGIVFPLILRSLYPKVGFQWALRIVSFICLFCFALSLIFVKERFSNKVEHVVEEGDQEQRRSTKLKNFIKTYFLDIFDYKSLLEPKFLFCTLAVALSESSLFVIIINFPSYAIKRGFSENTSYLLITIVNTTGVLGRYIPGYIADKFLGGFNVVMLTLFGCLLISFILWLPFGYSLKILYSYAALYGFCSGSILSLSPVCCGQISRTDQFGKRFSTMYLIVSVVVLVCIPIGGAVIGDGSIDRYNKMIIYAGMLNVGGIISYFMCRYFCVGLKLCKF